MDWLFDGIAALMCGLGRLNCEIDKNCKRLVRKRWPGVLELGDITSVNYDIDFALP